MRYTNPTSPTGKTYLTHPGSGLLAAQPPPDAAPTSAARGLQMPTRRRTRAAARAQRINTERAHNDAHVAQRNQPPPF